VRSVLIERARDLAVPLRHFSPQVRYCGAFYGQTDRGEPYPEGISVDGLLQILAALPAGVTELACHAGDAVDLDSMYRTERADEVRTLCDPRVRAALTTEQIATVSFGDVGRIG